MTDAAARDGSRDFDLFHGSWRIANRRLRSRLTGSTDWEEFGAQGTCRPLLGGLGNILDYRPTDWAGHEDFEGCGLRLYDREQGVWRIWWMSTDRGNLDIPMVGRFIDGVGTFVADDLHRGKPVRCRFLWHDIREDRATWEQALSADGGKTWETNWVMSYTRAE